MKTRIFFSWMAVGLRRLLSAFLVWGILLVAGQVSAADFSTWVHKMPITFSGYGKPETLTNFPVLLRFGTNITGFSYTDYSSPTNGADLRFSASNQTDELNYEIERWDTNGVSYVWVQVPVLAGTNTQIWAYWGKSGAGAPAYTTNGATWENAYRGVWHLNESSGTTVYDSTSNKTIGTCSGGVTVNTLGIVAGGDQFDGINGLTTMVNENLFDFGLNPFCVSFWIKNTKSAPGSQEWTIISKGAWPSAAWAWELEVSSWSTPPGVGTYLLTTIPPGYVGSGGSSLATNGWQHVAYVRQGSNICIYADGMRKTDQTNSYYASDFQNTYSLRIANPIFAATGFGGSLDEVELTAAYRSSNWIWACWSNQMSNSTFVSYGATVNVTLTSAVGDPTASNPIPVTVTFSEDVTGFASGDLVTTNASVVNFMALSGSNYTFDLAPTVQGLVSVIVPAGVCSNGEGLSNEVSALFTRLYDTVVPTLQVSPSGFTNAVLQDYTVTSQTAWVWNSATNGYGSFYVMPYLATSDVSWLSVQSGFGTNRGGSNMAFTVSYDVSGFAPSETPYTGNVWVTATDASFSDSANNSPRRVPFSVRVNARPVISLTPPGIAQTVDRGSNPTNTQFRLWNASAAPVLPMAYTLTKDVSWFYLNPSSGTLALHSFGEGGSIGEQDTIEMSFGDMTGFADGTFTGRVTVTALDAGSGYLPLGVSQTTDLVVSITFALPIAPSGVSASDGTYTDRVAVNWQTSSRAARYEVWRGEYLDFGYASKLTDVD
ncbi:MAG: DUF2341 domain-containing protein, partial [Lentisphaerae bacterium]|nr:DUF2341 domain-containing protein [Lentisphaerota bacterium]